MCNYSFWLAKRNERMTVSVTVGRKWGGRTCTSAGSDMGSRPLHSLRGGRLNYNKLMMGAVRFGGHNSE